MTNTGNQTWAAGGTDPVLLGVHFTSTGGGAPNNTSGWWLSDQRFTLPNDVAPGASVSLGISITAPNTSGSFVLEYQMLKPNHFWFTQFADVHVSVS